MCHAAGKPGSLCPLSVAPKISVVSHLPHSSVQGETPGSYLLSRQGSERDFCPNLHFALLTAVQDIRVCLINSQALTSIALKLKL